MGGPKWLVDIVFGLCFGMGFFVAKAVLDLIVQLLSHHG